VAAGVVPVPTPADVGDACAAPVADCERCLRTRLRARTGVVAERLVRVWVRAVTGGAAAGAVEASFLTVPLVTGVLPLLFVVCGALTWGCCRLVFSGGAGAAAGLVVRVVGVTFFMAPGEVSFPA
jgi:hypothetical protein